MLDPVSVSLEAHDLPAFFRGMILKIMADHFEGYSQEFQRLTVNELNRKLVTTAERVFATPMPSPLSRDADDAALLEDFHDEQFDLFCFRTGVKNPGAERRAREAAEQAEIERIKAADRALDEFMRGPL